MSDPSEPTPGKGDQPPSRDVLSSLFADRRDASRRSRRLLGFLAGLILLAAAILAVARNADPLATAWSRLSLGPWWLLPAMVLLPALHLPITGAVFFAATPRDAMGRPRVGILEMTALIAVGNLANYLPLRPGMVARLAYHRTVNNIPIIESARILATVVASGLIAASLLWSAAYAGARISTASLSPAAFLAIPAAFGLMGALLLNARQPVSPVTRWWTVLTLRYVDLCVWTLRYALAFSAIGLPLTPSQAALYAIVANAAMLLPIAGNGLGVREWAIAWAGPLLPAAILGTGAVQAQGLSADLLNRAFEVLVSVVSGTLAAGWVSRHLAHLAAARQTAREANKPPTPGAPSDGSAT